MPTDSGLARGSGSVAAAGSANKSAIKATHNERIFMHVSPVRTHILDPFFYTFKQ
jgi:hypothetical protein